MKLDYWRIGPFKVLHQVGKNAFHLELPAAFLQLHPVFNVNLLKRYTDPVEFGNCINVTHPAADVQLALAGENPLKVKKFLDMHKVGHWFEYLVEQLDKPLSETSWLLLSDIPNSYDEMDLESFHHHHPKLPQPAKFSSTPLKDMVPMSTDILMPPPPSPLTEWQSESYTPWPQMTMHSGQVSWPANLDRIMESIMN